MSFRQYIGARYVPKFFEGDDGNNWISGLTYEPLTIVTYNNTQYTSKKPVPATVGSPNLNPEYWVATGDYNAQVEEYREEVEEVKELIETKFNQANAIDFSSSMSFYVDRVNGLDTNDGSIEHPFLTLDKAIEQLNTVSSNVYIFFKTAGTYTVSEGIINGVTIHFEPLVDDVTIDFINRACTFYNCHVNFNSTKQHFLTVRHAFTGENPQVAATIENCSTYAQKTIFKMNLYMIGGFFWFTDVTFDDATIVSTQNRSRLDCRGSVCILQNITIHTDLAQAVNILNFNHCPKVQMWGTNNFNASVDQTGNHLMFLGACFTTLQTFFNETGVGRPHGLIYSDLGYLNYALCADAIDALSIVGTRRVYPTTNYAEVRIAEKIT